MLSDKQLEKLVQLFEQLSEKQQEEIVDVIQLKHLLETGKFIDEEEDK